jgi:hypothetical protein
MMEVKLIQGGNYMVIINGAWDQIEINRDEAFELIELINEHIGMMPVSLEGGEK